MFQVHSRDPADSPSSTRGRHLLSSTLEKEKPGKTRLSGYSQLRTGTALSRDSARFIGVLAATSLHSLRCSEMNQRRTAAGETHPSRLSSSISLKLFTLSGNHAAQLSFQYRIAGAAPTPQSAACNENVYSRPAS